MSTQLPIPSKPLQFLWFGLRPLRWWFFVALTLTTVTSILHLLSPFLFKFVIDAIEVGNTSHIIWFLMMYPALFFTVNILYRLTAVCMTYVTVNGKQYLYEALSGYVLGHSQAYFSDHFAGSLANRLNKITTAYEAVLDYAVWNYTDAFVSILFTTAVLWHVYPSAAMVLGGLVVTLVMLNLILVPKNQRRSYISTETQAVYAGALVDVLTNASLVRQFSRLSQELHTLGGALRTAAGAEFRAAIFSILMILSNGIVIAIGYGMVLWLVAQAYLAGEISTGNAVLVLGLLVQLAYMLLYLGNAFQNGSSHYGELSSGLHELIVPHGIIDLPHAAPLTLTSAPEIAFKNVWFTYQANTPVFTDFSLTIAPGQRVGIVGYSGAGKSSLVSLLLRQYEVQSGEITIGGQSISSVMQDSLRTTIALVSQEAPLFHRTIRENIAYGNPTASTEEIIAVAKKAQAHDFIMNLPHGYDTLVGERGVKLSGGQKQRIAIARAMLKNAPILILDEATSALDSESEQAIQTALHFLMANKTVIAIAHRLSTLREMDRVIVLENGKVAEDGTHETLVSFGGIYQRLWEHQVGGFVSDRVINE